MRDSQKQKVYSAETHLRCRGLTGTRFDNLKSIDHWVNKKILKSGWFKKNFPTGPYELQILLGKKKNSRWAYGSTTQIWLPFWAWTPLTVLHEVTHGITRLKYKYPLGYSHNWAFTKTFLMLIKKFMDNETATLLRNQYVSRRVKHRKPPVLSEETKRVRQVRGFALAAKLQAKREGEVINFETIGRRS